MLTMVGLVYVHAVNLGKPRFRGRQLEKHVCNLSSLCTALQGVLSRYICTIWIP